MVKNFKVGLNNFVSFSSKMDDGAGHRQCR